MKAFLAIVPFFLFSSFSGNDNVPIPIDDAVKSGKATCAIQALANSTHYGKNIVVDLKNTGSAPMQIVVPNGFAFEPMDSDLQNMVVTKQEVIVLAPMEKKQVELYAMCTEPSDGAADETTKYKFGKPWDSKMKTLTAELEKRRAFDALGQNAVWCMASKDEGLENISGFDTITSKSLRELVAQLTGRPLPDPNLLNSYEYNYHYAPTIIQESINGSYDFSFSKPKDVSIGMFNANGILVRELYNQKQVAPGTHKYDFEFDSMVYTDDVYYIKMIVDSKVVINREVKTGEIRNHIFEQEDRD